MDHYGKFMICSITHKGKKRFLKTTSFPRYMHLTKYGRIVIMKRYLCKFPEEMPRHADVCEHPCNCAVTCGPRGSNVSLWLYGFHLRQAQTNCWCRSSSLPPLHSACASCRKDPRLCLLLGKPTAEEAPNCCVMDENPETGSPTASSVSSNTFPKLLSRYPSRRAPLYPLGEPHVPWISTTLSLVTLYRKQSHLIGLFLTAIIDWLLTSNEQGSAKKSKSPSILSSRNRVLIVKLVFLIPGVVLGCCLRASLPIWTTELSDRSTTNSVDLNQWKAKSGMCVMWFPIKYKYLQEEENIELICKCSH